jgi:hypothetical protein
LLQNNIWKKKQQKQKKTKLCVRLVCAAVAEVKHFFRVEWEKNRFDNKKKKK